MQPREQVAEDFAGISDFSLIVVKNICSTCSGVNGGFLEQLVERSTRFLSGFERKKKAMKKKA
jgi:hypothetical protein